ncbi:CRISPR-associated CARF protein Csa3 [Tardisphaera miroshnichenkoae]
MLVVISLGFNENSPLRYMIRKGLKETDTILIAYPRQSKEDERALRARQALIKIISSIYQQIKIVEFSVNVQDFYGAVMELGQKIAEMHEPDIYVNLSGGMRALIAEILSALELFRINSEVTISLEDGSGEITFRSSDLSPKTLDKVMLQIISEVHSGHGSVVSISNNLGVPKSTIWRKAVDLEKMGILLREGKEYSLTDVGKLYAMLNKSL